MFIVSLLIISNFLLLTNCQNKCNTDKRFSHEFNNCILLVHKLNSENASSTLKVRVFTYECLFALTGYEGRVDKSNEPHCFYPHSDSVDFIKEDIEIWLKWYELNKCTMTIEKADSIIQRHSIEFGIDSLQWPPSVNEIEIVND